MEASYTDGVAKNGIYYEWYGKKTSCPLVGVVGYGGNLATWTPDFVERLGEFTDVIVFDHLGSGRSAALEEGCDATFSDFAEHIRGLIDELKLDAVNLFGYSMGGCISLEFMRVHGAHVQKLILQSTTGGGTLYHSCDAATAERMRNPRGTTFEEMYFDFLSISMPSEAIERHRQTLQAICDRTREPATPLHVLQMKLRAFRNFDSSGYIGAIERPTLVIHGKNDQLIPVENGKALAEHLPNAQLVLFDDCGHYPHIEHQDEVLEAIRAHLSGL